MAVDPTIDLPAPTAWPVIVAFGVTLIFAGLVTNAAISVLGLVAAASGIVAVNDRPNTDFLWQRSPFLLFGGGAGLIETAAIDYILSYWMARYYGLTP